MKVLQRHLPVGALGISLILHLAIFLGISSVIIIQAVAPKIIPVSVAEVAPVDYEAPPEPEVLEPSASVAEEGGTSLSPAVNLEAISSAAVTVSVPLFTVAPPTAVVGERIGGVVSGVGRGTGGRSMPNPFGGKVSVGDGALVGHLYDLKQTVEGQPTRMTGDSERVWDDPREDGVNNEFTQFLARFISGSWDERELARYYKVEEPLGIFQLFVPRMDAELAPKAFHAEQYVKPRRWLIVYRGQFTAPAGGTYRFAGGADDELAVRLGNRVVLDVGRNLLGGGIKRERLGPLLFGGEWFELKEGQSYPLQILLSEVPGGWFYAHLLIQEKGKSYASRQGRKELGPALPVFQLAPVNLPGSYQPEVNAPTVAREAFICR